MTNNFSKKICAIVALILAFSSSNLAFAQDTKSRIKLEEKVNTQDSSQTQKVGDNLKVDTANKNEDPDLRLSIEELRKKYPISLLDEKKKTYKTGQKINIDDYSIEEIKAAFLNADRNFISRMPLKEMPIVNGKYDAEMLSNDVKVHSQLELDIIDETCNKLGSNIITTPKKYQILQLFLFSKDKVLVHAGRFVATKTGTCFSISDPFELEDRN